jgi:hypothetical protein
MRLFLTLLAVCCLLLAINFTRQVGGKTPPSTSLLQTTFTESFNNAPNYSNNWLIAGQTGSTITTYTSGNFRIQSPPVCTSPGSGTSISYRSKQAFVGDLDVSFQLNHGGFGRTTVGLWSATTNQFVIQSILDTDDTAYLNFGSGVNFTEYTYSSAPYLNKWITLRIQVVGSIVNFYADNGSGLQLLKTWPAPSSSSVESYYLAFNVGSVCWKSGANDTSFRLITATGTPSAANIETGWVYTSSYNIGRVSHGLAKLNNGQVLIVGGEVAYAQVTDDAQLYDPILGRWSPTGKLNVPRNAFSTTRLDDGKVLVAGGFYANTQQNQKTAELYDPATRTWALTDEMQEARNLHFAVKLSNGKVLVSGGAACCPNVPLKSAELYDPATRTWTRTGDMNQARNSIQSAAVLLHNGKVLVVGGGGPTGILQTAEVYDPATGTWTFTGNMKEPRSEVVMTLLTTGKVLVSGGAGASGTPLKTCEIYDPATGTWSYTGEMQFTRILHTSTLLPSGKVLVAGDTFGNRSTAEVYDPARGVWSSAGNLNVGRGNHRAVLLDGGRVLVTGGYDGGSLLSSAELWVVGWDAVRDFSIAANPNGDWSYGYSNTLGGPFTPFSHHDANVIQGIERWGVPPAIDPAVNRNTTNAAITGPTGTNIFPPDMLLLHPGPAGEYSIVRWTAPAAGTYSITGAFRGLDRGNTTTDDHIRLNSSTSLFSTTINSFDEVKPFSINRTLNAGDTLDFAVGFGDNGAYNNDSTGLAVTITRVDSPTPTPTPTPSPTPTPTPTPTPCTISCNANVRILGHVDSPVVFSSSLQALGCSSAPVYEWDFGDKSPLAYGQVTLHSYVTTGFHTWTLKTTINETTCIRKGEIYIEPPPPVVRRAPYDFYTNCNEESSVAGNVSHASAITNSFHQNGQLSLNIQAAGIVANSFARAGIGVRYTPIFTGKLKIKALVEVGPGGFDLVTTTWLPKLSATGVASITSDVYIKVSPPVNGLASLTNFRKVIVGVPGSSPSKFNPIAFERHLYTPAERYWGDYTISVTKGSQVNICAGIQSKGVVGSLLPGTFTSAKALYNAKVIEIRIEPQ